MGEVPGASVFLPYKMLNNLSCANLFGYCVQTKSCIISNSVMLVETDKCLNDFLFYHQFVNETFDFQTNLQFLGIVYASKKKLKFFSKILEKYYKHMWFILRIDNFNNSFHLEKYNSHDSYSVNFIFYDSFELLNSHLLFSLTELDSKKSLVSFLVSSLRDNGQFSFLNFNKDKKFLTSSFASEETDYCSPFLSVSQNIERTFHFVKNIDKTSWWFKNLVKLVRLSHVGQQVHQRMLHMGNIFLNPSIGYNDLKRKNLIFSMILDVMLGMFITFFILKLDLHLLFLANTIQYTNNIVKGLQKLIFWLNGVPAGLKLNIPLNSALGHFFLYHIYLWEAYIAIILPVFQIVLKISTFIGIFGLTFVLSLLSDIISLASIHIFCFYGYATRLYGYQISCLASLWRLFRGKKWNPLRQRVDSYSFDVHQLYLGTLLFTVLLFLFPTVFIYYLVFMSLRMILLTVQGLFSVVIDIFSVLPLYTVGLRLLNSSVTNGDIYFSVFSSEGESLVLSMKFIQASICSVIRNTLPETRKYEKIVGWKELMSKILIGDIIYRL